jgi:protein-S-isoprenylcysteine O-methyltransferase Ste14
MSIAADPLQHTPIVVDSTAPHRERKTTLTSWIARSRGWISLVLLTPVAIGAAFSPLWCSPNSWGCFWIDCLGWSLFICGGAMRWWATLYIGGRKSVELISDGPYSMSRNPIYFGTFLLTIAVGAWAQSVAFLFAVVLVALAYVVLTTAIEEQALLRCYGDAFQAYRHRVPRFAPDVRLFHSRSTIEVQTKGLRNELLRTCRWVWIPILCNLVTHLRSEAWWPVWFSLP